MLLRILRKALFVLFLAGCQSVPSQNDASGVDHRFIPSEDFVRIAEYFSGIEQSGNRLYLRSNSDVREGYYWIVDLPHDLRERDVRVRLEVQIPGSPEVRTFRFEVPTRGATSVWVGVTGQDWPSEGARPVAWRLSLGGTDGTAAWARESFLWPDSRDNGSDE